MGIDRNVVDRLLAELEQTVATLRRLQGATLAELTASPERAWAVEHGLQIARWRIVRLRLQQVLLWPVRGRRTEVIA